MPKIVRESLNCLAESLLHHVRGVDSGGEPAIHPHADHMPQAIPVPCQNLLPGKGITPGCAVK